MQNRIRRPTTFRVGMHTYYFVGLGQGAPTPEKSLQQAEERILTFPSQLQGSLFLRNISLDRWALRAMRRLAAEIGVVNPWRLSDRQILGELGARLFHNRLRVVDRYLLGGGSSPGADGDAPVRRRSASEAVAGPKTVAAPEPDPPTFAPDHLQNAQAAALIEAAVLGVPFCEECLKQALKRMGQDQEEEAA